MRVTLPAGCNLLAPIKDGSNYALHICPLMFSRATTVDLDLLRAAAIQAYESLSGLKASNKFGIELRCVLEGKIMSFYPVRVIPFDDSAQLLQRIIPPKNQNQSNTIDSYFSLPSPKPTL
jgi:hypothetical protein